MPSSIAAKRAATYRIQVLDRAFGILDVLADKDAGCGLAEVAGILKLHKATTHRLLMVLEGARYVERDAAGRYRLGSRIMELGLSALSRLDVCEVARPHLRALVEKTGETAHLAVLRDAEMVSLIDVESRQTVRTPSVVGQRRPAYCNALGKAILAFLADEQVDEYLKGRVLKPYTPRTITSAARLRTELRMVHELGYALDDEEWETGLRCIGAPVRDSIGSVIAAISISGPSFRMDPERLEALGAAVVQAAAKISEALCYRGGAS